MDRRTAVYVLMLATFGVMGGAKVSFPQEPAKSKPLTTETETLTFDGPEQGLGTLTAKSIEFNPNPKEMFLEFTVETLTITYKGQEKKISVQQLFDAL